jgi:hypothetical protein
MTFNRMTPLLMSMGASLVLLLACAAVLVAVQSAIGA